MKVGLTVAAASDVGRVRTHNEDAYVTGGWLWAVADGMGGQAAGDKAASIAVQCLEDQDAAGPVDQPAIAGLISRINGEILTYGRSHPEAAGLGTTLAGIALVELAGRAHWLVFHIGDSRVYRLTDGHLLCETTDHSEVQSLVDRGTITALEARTHPQRNVLTRCLGSYEEPRADMRLVPYIENDRLLVCSDGLTTEVDDATIEHILLTSSSPREAAGNLVSAALCLGGRDNVTVVVVGAGNGDEQEAAWEDTIPMLGNEE